MKKPEFDFLVERAFDNHCRPEDFECYDNEQKQAWMRGDWCFLGVIVTACLDGVKLATASLWGIESDSTEDYFAHVEAELREEAATEAEKKLSGMFAKLFDTRPIKQELESRFPWLLDEDASASGADTIDQISDWHREVM